MNEPNVPQSLKIGCDLVLFSGDKLLGGPQAGIILGKKELITPIKTNPLARVVRVDKMTIAALEATLLEYFDEEFASKNIPTLKMIKKTEDELKKDADKLLSIINNHLDESFEISLEKGESRIGGGSFPLYCLPAFLVAIQSKNPISNIEKKLRENNPPIITRIFENKILFDPLTLFPEDYEIIKNFFAKL